MDFRINLEKLNQSYELVIAACTAAISSSKIAFGLILAWFLALLLPCTLIGVGVMMGTITDKLLGFKQAGPFGFVGTAFPGLVFASLNAGWNTICLKAADGKEFKMKELIQDMPTIISCGIILVLSVIATTLGCCLLVLPGLFFFVKFQLAPFYAVDKHVGAIEAMKLSWAKTNEIFIQLAFIDIAFVVLKSVSSPTFVVPFFCFILESVTLACVYRRFAAPLDDDDD